MGQGGGPGAKKQQTQVILWFWGVWFDTLEPKNQLILGFPDQMEKLGGGSGVWVFGLGVWVFGVFGLGVWVFGVFDFGHQRARPF